MLYLKKKKLECKDQKKKKTNMYPDLYHSNRVPTHLFEMFHST